MDEIEGRPAAGGLAAHDQARDAVDGGPRVAELAVGDSLPQVGRQPLQLTLQVVPRDHHTAIAQVDDRLDATLFERLAKAAVDDVVLGRAGRQPGVRDGDRQVEARLRRGIAQDLLMETVLDEQVGARAEQDGRHRHQRHERDGQARPDAADHLRDLTGRPCSPRPRTVSTSTGVAGSASILARRRWIATSTRRESPR